MILDFFKSKNNMLLESGQKFNKWNAVFVLVISVVSMVAVFLSIRIYQISNEINSNHFYGLTAQGLATAWGAQDDDLRIIRSITNNGASLIDLHPLREAYGYYLYAKLFLEDKNKHFPSEDYVKTESLKISNFNDYDKLSTEYQATYDKLNVFVSANVNEAVNLEDTQNVYFVYLIVIQIITALLGIASLRIL